MVSAQSLRNADQPAEFPPASFTAKQYVDSKGCVYVRAGFDGAVTWVPRVSRSRKVLCGFQPTFAQAAAPDTAPRAAEAPAPEPPAAKPKPPRRVAAVAPARTPRVVAPAPARTPAPVRSVAPTRVAVAPPQPARTVKVRPAPVQAAPAAVVRPIAPASVATACPGASVLSQRYLASGSYAVRCGPQTANPAARTTVRGVAPDTSTVRIKPAPAIAPPAGYRAAFEDDRFNPNRGLQSSEGVAQMRLVWSSGVPRRLVKQNTGRD